MELVRFVTAKPTARRFWAPFTANSPTIASPLNGDINTIVNMPLPQSGMERAQWWEANRVKSANENPGVCSVGKPVIGAMERQLLGPTRDEFEGGLILRSHNWYDYPEQITENSARVPDIWTAQVTSSKGLWDEHNDVWVSMDSETIWA